MSIALGTAITGGNADGSVLFQDTSGNLNEDQPGNFVYDVAGTGPLATKTRLYIGDVKNDNSSGAVALYDKTLKTWGAIVVDDGYAQFGPGVFTEVGFEAEMGVDNVAFSAYAYSSQTKDLFQWNGPVSGGSAPLYGRINHAGYLMIDVTSAPSSGDVNTGEVAMWYDKTSGAPLVNFYGKDSGGTAGAVPVNMPGRILGVFSTNSVETTSSTSFVDLTTLDEVTFTLGTTTNVLVMYKATEQLNSGGPNSTLDILNFDGTQDASAITQLGFSGVGFPAGALILYKKSLAAGSHTIKVQHRVDGGTGSWASRGLVVFQAP